MAQRKYAVEVTLHLHPLHSFHSYKVNGKRLRRSANLDSCRRIFIGKDVILKEGSAGQARWSGTHQNQREVEFYQTASPEVRRRLAKLLAWAPDFTWVLQRRYRLKRGKVTKAQAQDMDAWVKAHGIGDVYSMAGRCPENWGVIKGCNRKIVFDYGMARNGSYDNSLYDYSSGSGERKVA